MIFKAYYYCYSGLLWWARFPRAPARVQWQDPRKLFNSQSCHQYAPICSAHARDPARTRARRTRRPLLKMPHTTRYFLSYYFLFFYKKFCVGCLVRECLSGGRLLARPRTRAQPPQELLFFAFQMLWRQFLFNFRCFTEVFSFQFLFSYFCWKSSKWQSCHWKGLSIKILWIFCL